MSPVARLAGSARLGVDTDGNCCRALTGLRLTSEGWWAGRRPIGRQEEEEEEEEQPRRVPLHSGRPSSLEPAVSRMPESRALGSLPPSAKRPRAQQSATIERAQLAARRAQLEQMAFRKRANLPE